MHDFDERRTEMRKRGDRVRRTAGVIMALAWIGLLLGLAATAYIVANPELLGQFAGRVVSGYQENDNGQ